jgi:hypothetical protein
MFNVIYTKCCVICSNQRLTYGVLRRKSQDRMTVSSHDLINYDAFMPIPVAVRPKAWVCGRSLTRIVGWNPMGHGCLHLWVLCVVSASGWSLVQRSPTECGVSKKSVIVKPRKMRRPRPPRGCRAIGKKLRFYTLVYELVVVKFYISVFLYTAW